MLVPGAHGYPEDSPDGAFVVFRGVQGTFNPEGVLRVARVDDGKLVPFEIRLGAKSKFIFSLGRARWTPDGKQILFTGQDERGRPGVFVQDFDPGKDTTESRRPVAGFDPEWITESLGLSSDGKRLVLSEAERTFSILVAEGIRGLERKGRTR